MGLFSLFKPKTSNIVVVEEPLEEVLQDIEQQIKSIEREVKEVNSADPLTPKELAGKKRRYHYQDVNIVVKWEYGGRYGKSCESIGMKRGDMIEILPPQNVNEDPECLAVYWRGHEIGFMKANRLRGMVHQWKSAGLPILAVVSGVGGENKLFIEFAFYGAPKK